MYPNDFCHLPSCIVSNRYICIAQFEQKCYTLCILILKRNTRPRYLQIHTKYTYQHNQNLDLLQNFKTNSFLLDKELFLKKSLAWKIWILTMFIQKLFCHALFFHIIYRKDFLKMHSKPSEAYVTLFTTYDHIYVVESHVYGIPIYVATSFD